MSNNQKLYSLTHPQNSIWLLEKMYPDTGIGNVAGTIRIKNNVDFSLLQKSVNMVIKNNDGMRIRVIIKDQEPKQYIKEYKEQKLDFFDFSNKKMSDYYNWEESDAKKPISVIDNDLFYFALIKINENDGRLYIKLHHLISDAWTMSLITNQVIEYYSLLKQGKIIEEKYSSYKDYIENSQKYFDSKRFIKDNEYWNDKFTTIPDITTLKVRNSRKNTNKAKRKAMVTPAKFSRKLMEFSKENNVSFYTLFLAGLAMYINRVTSKTEIIIGTPILNRSNNTEKNTIGMFASTAVPVLINIQNEMRFIDFIQIISKEIMTTLRHQKYPYNLLIKELREKHGTSDGLFDIVLSYQNSTLNKDKDLEDYTTRWHFNGYQIESLCININDREEEGRLIFDYDFLEDLFYLKEIEFIHSHILTLLWHALDNPVKQIKDIEILTEAEKHKILYDFNNTETQYPNNKLIHQIFEEQAQKTPNLVAVLFENNKLSYSELNKKSNQLAYILRNMGVSSDSIVGIMTHRSLEMMIGILAILKAGGAYLPIDPEYPADRINYILKDSKTKLLLSDLSGPQDINFDGDIFNLKDKSLYLGKGSNLNIINKPNDLCYIIYTSGTTGKPKGVMIEHHSIINRINWMQKKYPISEDSTILQKTPFTFDVSVWELFWWFFVGAKVCFLKPGGEKDPQEIIDTVNKNKISTMHFVPSMLSIFLNYIQEGIDIKLLSSIKQIFSSGEALSKEKVLLFNKLLNTSNGTELYNLYGPTEATVDVSYFDCSPKVSLNTIPIGKPIDNIKLYILDKNNKLLPIGIAGELCIGGAGLARGYINKEKLTNEKFIPNPFIPGDKIYKTGDLARWFSQGDIEYLGRLDHQVKIRGNRIELGEIESRLLQHKHITDAVVIDKEDENNRKYLCAYIVCKKELTNREVKDFIMKDLPSYMVPSIILKLNNMPLSPNGKIDRKSLPNPDGVIASESKYVEPRNTMEKILVNEWERVLKIKKIGINDNFFNLGGDSLNIIEILTKIHKYNMEITVSDFYTYQTIKEISDKLRGVIKDDMVKEPVDIESVKPQQEIKKITSVNNNQLRNILLTGATGFLGMHLISELLNNTSATIYCLVRGESKVKAQDRLRNLLKFYFGKKYMNLIEKRIIVVNGDVSKNNLGLSQQTYKELGSIIDSVIHSAAMVKYYGDYKEIENVNVVGTKNIISLCINYNIKLNYISTVSITGNYLVDNKCNKEVFTENEFYIGQSYTQNVYVRSKFEAENLIYKYSKKGLIYTVLRMGNLTGRYLDGHFQHNISENAFYSSIKSIIEIGAISKGLLNEEIEFTPIDVASKSITSIITTNECNGRIFHIFNNNTIKVKEVISFFNYIGIKVNIFDKDELKLFIENKSKGDKDIISGLMVYMNNTGELTHLPSIYIDSDLTNKYLSKLGFIWPEIDDKYLLKLIKYMKKVKYLNLEDRNTNVS